MSQYYYGFRSKEESEKIKVWWEKLKDNLGWRAELRRAENPPEVLLCQGFRFLYYEIAGYWTKSQNLIGLAAAAGVLAHIKYSDNKTFTESCASSLEGNDKKPALSELRFSQLLKSRTLDELYIRMIRAIRILREKADPVSVAESVLHWYREMEIGEAENGARNRILVRWGLDYFQNIPR